MKQIFNLDHEEIKKQFGDHFCNRYYSRIFHNPAGLEGYSNWCTELFKTCDAYNKKIFDVGCGYGLVSIHFAILGASFVCGMDIQDLLINTANKIIKRLQLKNISLKLGDVIDSGYDDCYFDVAIVNEMISHVRSVRLLIREINRVLKGGGKILIRDGSNVMTEQILRNQEILEFGPLPEVLKQYHNINVPYSEMRKNIIKRNYPSVNANLLRVLVEATRGFDKNQILQACEEYLKTGNITKKSLNLCRDPETGEWNDRRIDPYGLVKVLSEEGFCEIRLTIPTFKSTNFPSLRKLNLNINSLLKPLYPFLLRKVSGFEILATNNKV